MRVLKQSTAATVMFGPFVDKTDGVTAETGLASAATEISKAGGAFGAGPTLGTHDSDGWYPISLTTTHTNTLGDLTIKGVDDATHLPVWAHFTVLPANAYDALVSGSGVGMRSDVQGWLGSAPVAVNSAGVPRVDLDLIEGANVSTTTAQLGVNTVQAGGTAWGSGAITVGVIAADAIGASELAADAVAEIADAVWDEDATAHQTQGTFGQAIGDPVADTNTIFKAVVSDATGATVGVDAAAILADTGTDGVVVAAASKTGYSLTATTGLGNQTADITGSLSGSVGSVTGAVGSVTGAVGSVTGAVTVGTINANVITAGSIAASALNGKGDWNVGKTGYSLTATTGLGNQTANITGDLSGSVGSVTGAVTVGTNNDKTGYRLDATGSAALTEGYAALGAAGTLPQILYEIRSLLAEKSIAGTTLTAKKLDGSTTAETFTLDSATAPTSITRAT